MIPRAAATALGESSAQYAIERLELTSTAVAVAVLASSDGAGRIVLKLPMVPEAQVGLDLETRVLASLHADGRLGDWPQLIPRALAVGSLDGRRFRVDSALPGSPAADELSADAAAGGFLIDAAAEAIHDLHRRTAVRVKADDALVERWIDDNVRELMARARR